VIAAAIEEEAVVTSDCNANEPEVRPAPVRVRVPNDQTSAAVRVPPPLEPVPANVSWRPVVPGVVKVDVATFQTSDARVPKVVSERVPLAQTAVGMVEAKEVEAVRTVEAVYASIVEMAEASWLLVLAFTLEASDVEAARIEEFVLPLITLASDDDALFVLALTEFVPAVIAAASEEVAELVVALITLASELDAVFVFAFTAVVTAAVCMLVLAFTLEASDVEAARIEEFVLALTAAFPVVMPVAKELEAARTAAFVFELMLEASDVEAARIAVSVWELTPLVIPDVCVFVFAFTFEARDVEAARIEEFVLPLITLASDDDALFVLALTEFVPAVIAAASEEEAVVTSDWRANEPEFKLAPVSVLVVAPQTAVAVSATTVPKLVSVRLV